MGTFEELHAWVIRDCSTPGCFTIIREAIGNQTQIPLCKWCQRGVSHAKNGHAAIDIRLKQV